MAAIPCLLCSSPFSEGPLCYASELPESLLSSQVFKLAKAAFIVYFGISHLVRTSDVKNNTNRQQIRWQQSKRGFSFSIVCLKESHYPSKKNKVVEPRISVHYRRKKFHLDKNTEWHWQISFFTLKYGNLRKIKTTLLKNVGLPGLTALQN